MLHAKLPDVCSLEMVSDDLSCTYRGRGGVVSITNMWRAVYQSVLVTGASNRIPHTRAGSIVSIYTARP